MNEKEDSPIYIKQGKNQLIGEYVIGKLLGTGTFGVVKKGRHIKTKKEVAIKIVNKARTEKSGSTVLIEREIRILKQVKHPNVIECFEVIETETNWYMIMELISGGELLDYIDDRAWVSEKEASKFFTQIIAGVKYLHKTGIYHRDLKLENIMLDSSLNVKIVDFGLSAFDEGKELKRQCGSIHYIAPEVLQGPYNGAKADIWSCGVIFYAMVTGEMPFQDDSEETAAIFEKILNEDLHLPGHLTDSCKSLIKRILCRDPLERISLTDLENHSFLRQQRYYNGSKEWRQQSSAAIQLDDIQV